MIAVTIDLDWAPDKLIRDTLDLLAAYDVRATVFCTHPVDVGPHEAALHPNFERDKTPLQATQELQRIFPQARGVRSHALAISTRIFEVYAQLGLAYDSSYYLPNQAIQPFAAIEGVLEIPIFFEDDLYFRLPEKHFALADLNMSTSGLKVFDFHPIHLFLNTHSMAHYQEAKPDYHDPAALARKVGRSRGTRDLFVELLEHIRQTGRPTYVLSEVETTARTGRRREGIGE